MYLYFSSNGTLKEIVNDSAIRQGNSKLNKIKIFIEGAEPQTNSAGVYQIPIFSSGVRTFIDVDGNELTTESFSLVPVVESISFNKKRELKYFEYWKKYQFLEITVPDDILNESGTVGCRVQLILDEGEDVQATLDSDDTILTLGLIVFNVEITTGGKAIIEPDTAINIAQWNYLLKKMSEVDYYTDNVMFITDNILLLTANSFNLGQVIYDKESKSFYKVIEVDSQKEFELEQLDIWNLENNGVKLIDILASKVDKTDLPNRLYGTDSSGNNKIYTIDEIREELNDVPSQQMTVAYITDPITNSNGYSKNGYAYVGLSGGAYRITYNGESLTEDQARDYMQYMCGSRFLPHYDNQNNKPQYTYFVIDNTVCFQVQYDGSDLILVRKESLFELKTNKVNEVNVHSTNTQYPSARCLYNNIKNVTELANGKTKTYVLSYQDTLASIKYDINQNGTIIFDENGNDISSAFVDGDYDYLFDTESGEYGYANPIFNSQNDDVGINKDYVTFVFRQIDTELDGYNYVLLTQYFEGESFNTGDILLVKETDVPDRWVGGKWLFNKMETSKIDLTSYYTKTETNNLLNNYYTKTETNSLLTSYVSLAGNQTITGFKAFSNGLSTTSIKGVATMTQAQYDALVSAGTVDADTFYFIEEE